MLRYSFLTLSLVLAIPTVIVWTIRPDLRRVIHRMALVSIPFAFTERLFYPDYWEPLFLFDLVNVVGFGIEDILFVTAIAGFSSTAWGFVARKTYVGEELSRRAFRRGGALLVACFAAVGILALSSVPMIYGAPAIMAAIAAGICTVRRDLVVPSLGGATVTLAVYTAACLALAVLIPEVFELDWKTDRFLDLYVMGVPVEELLYAWTAGLIATSFYPFVTGARLVPRDAIVDDVLE